MTEANAERLEVIKEMYKNDEDIHQFDIEWLIEQAEQNVEGEGGFFGKLAAKKCEENKRLREALKFYAELDKYNQPFIERPNAIHMGDSEIQKDCGNIARQALEVKK